MPKKVSIVKLTPLMQVGPYERADVVALQAVAQGYADETQQKRAMEYIIYQLCDFDGVAYYDNERDTSFALGKRFVARAIHTILTENARKLEEPNRE